MAVPADCPEAPDTDESGFMTGSDQLNNVPESSTTPGSPERGAIVNDSPLQMAAS